MTRLLPCPNQRLRIRRHRVARTDRRKTRLWTRLRQYSNRYPRYRRPNRPLSTDTECPFRSRSFRPVNLQMQSYYKTYERVKYDKYHKLCSVVGLFFQF